MKDKLLDANRKNQKNNTQSVDTEIYSGLLGLISNQKKEGDKKPQENNIYGGLLYAEKE